ncbi:S41 family peptidase [uncultured Algibacter sp.]|uniref:S41 family peptidase n=1 Tax=uncultured Algibacter sp. TaxID=298659 RepID=UPI00262220C5|nr:S41 family peptidase [uncultured Algibacter sp.]
MKNYKALLVLIVTCFLFTSCFEDNDDNTITASQINDFVWKGMNAFYLYKDNSPNLANDRFSNNGEYADYLNSFSSPEELFESLIYNRPTIDQFSWITDDYFANDDFLNARGLTSGMQYTFISRSDNDPVRYGIVLYVFPESDADDKGIKRGDIFYAVNGTELFYNSPIDNNYSLLNANSFSLDLGTYNTNGTPDTADDFVTPLNQSITLVKEEFIENPIHVSKVLNVGGKTIGYLMYNGFNGSSSELNDAFGSFKSASVTDLVVDLRYNGGGFNTKAILLSSLITGQFTGEVLNKRLYNSELQPLFEDQDPEFLLDRFIDNEDGLTLNSLNLTKVYFLTTRNSASASELVINALEPYIDVVQIGQNTRGKYQGSFTIYDSPDFKRQGANPNHTYALQPLVFKFSNVNDNTDFFNGLEPNTPLSETRTNLGILGDENEPLLAEAIGEITGSGKSSKIKNNSLGILDSFENASLSGGKLIDDREFPKAIIQRLIIE